jgi:hypothetical protein
MPATRRQRVVASAPRRARSPEVTYVPRLCQRDDLASRFVGGEAGTGKWFGGIVVRNIGQRPCRLSGRVRFSAYYQSGRRDSLSRVVHDPGFEPQFLGRSLSIVLRGQLLHSRSNVRQHPYLDAVLEGAGDDPSESNGLCKAHEELTPRWFVLRVGQIAIHTVNRGSPGPNDMPSMSGCFGDIALAAILKNP